MAICPKCLSNSVIGNYCGVCGARIGPCSAESQSQSQNELEKEKPVITKNDLQLCQELIKQNPTSLKNYLNLIHTQIGMGRYEQAYSAFRAAKTLFADDCSLLKVGAKVLSLLGRAEEAAECLKLAIKQSGINENTVFELADLLIERGKKEEALEELKNLDKAHPKEPRVLIKLARLSLSLKNAEDSRKYLSEYRKTTGSTLEMYLLLGQTMLAESFYDGALKNFSEGKKAFPNNSQISLGLGKAYLGMNETKKALAEFKEALSKNPDNIECLIELAKLQNQMGCKEAEQSLKQIEESKKSSGDNFFALGIYFIERSDFSKGIYYLQKGLELSPYSAEAQKTLAKAYIKLKKYSEAIKIYQTQIESSPESVWAHEGIISCAEQTQNLKLKADSQKKLLEITPEKAEKWCDYGETLVKLGELDNAKNAFEKAAKLDPTCVRAYGAPELIRNEKMLAEAEKLVSQAKEAIKKRFFLTAADRLKRALELVPDKLEWVKMLSDTACLTADTSRAASLLSYIHSAEPDNIEASLKLAKIYELEEKPNDAIKLLNEVIKQSSENISAQISLFKLKRAQLRPAQISRDFLEAVNKAIKLELTGLKPNSPVSQTVRGYAWYIYSFGSKYQKEGLAEAERLFSDVIARFGEFEPVLKGLCLTARAKSDIEKAAEYAKRFAEASGSPEGMFYLAKLYENFGQCQRAKECYEALSEKFNENAFYHRKKVEMLALSSIKNKQNTIANFMAEKNKQAQNGSKWALFELAAAKQTVAEQAPNDTEKAKKALLSWHKAALAHKSPWAQFEALKCRLKYAKQGEAKQIAETNLKKFEKILREMPDNHESFLAISRCCLAYGDLTNAGKALEYLKKAYYLAQNCSEIIALTAKTAEKLGKSLVVDAMTYNMLLLEPELCFLCF